HVFQIREEQKPDLRRQAVKRGGEIHPNHLEALETLTTSFPNGLQDRQKGLAFGKGGGKTGHQTIVEKALQPRRILHLQIPLQVAEEKICVPALGQGAELKGRAIEKGFSCIQGPIEIHPKG